MKDGISKILDNYSSRGANHKITVEAANDPSLPTTELIKKALKIVELERSDIEVDNLALLVLQQRADKEVLRTAFSLLQSLNPVERQLGCQLLRELPSLDEAPYPHSSLAVEALKQMIANEKDEEVLIWALAAVG
jgi:hypothetical protein